MKRGRRPSGSPTLEGSHNPLGDKPAAAHDFGPAILALIGENPNGVTTANICRATRTSPQELGTVFERLLEGKKLLGFAGLWLTPSGWDQGRTRLIAALESLHDSDPTHEAIDPKLVVSKAGLTWSGKSLDRILARLAAENFVDNHPEGVTLHGFQPALSPRRRALLDRVLAEIEAEPVNTPTPHAIAQSLGVPIQAVQEILRVGARTGEVIQLADTVYYTPTQLKAIQERVQKLTRGKPISPSSLRDALKTTRKYVLPLLDYLSR